MTVKVGLEDVAKLISISTRTVRRSLGRLEEAGLINIERKNGQKNTITLIDQPPVAAATSSAYITPIVLACD